MRGRVNFFIIKGKFVIFAATVFKRLGVVDAREPDLWPQYSTQAAAASERMWLAGG